MYKTPRIQSRLKDKEIHGGSYNCKTTDAGQLTRYL